jgi:hypothetical protein
MFNSYLRRGKENRLKKCGKMMTNGRKGNIYLHVASKSINLTKRRWRKAGLVHSPHRLACTNIRIIVFRDLKEHSSDRGSHILKYNQSFLLVNQRIRR